jgi:hypothetical protein
MRALRALSRVDTNEASSRNLLCATHDLAPLSVDRMVDGARVFPLGTTMRENRALRSLETIRKNNEGAIETIRNNNEGANFY